MSMFRQDPLKRAFGFTGRRGEAAHFRYFLTQLNPWLGHFQIYSEDASRALDPIRGSPTLCSMARVKRLRISVAAFQKIRSSLILLKCDRPKYLLEIFWKYSKFSQGTSFPILR